MSPTSICVYHASDGREWGKYLSAVLQRNKALELNVAMYDVDSGSSDPGDKSDSMVKLLLVSPDFLERCNGPLPPWFPTIDHSSVIALLCSVEASHFTAARKYRNWTRLYLNTSDSAVKKLVEEIVKVADECEECAQPKPERPAKLEPPRCPKAPVPIPAPRTKQPTTSVSPQSQRSPVSHQVLIPTQSTLRINKVMPHRIIVPGEEIIVIFANLPKEDDALTVEIKGTELPIEKINGYTIAFRAPLDIRGKATMVIYENGLRINSYPLTFEHPDMTGLSYIKLMAQVLGVPLKDRETLDLRLVEIFNRSVPADTSHQAAFSQIMEYSGDLSAQRSSEQLPTLLHFAAANGLHELCCRVLELPGALVAYQIENCNGCDPGRLAEEAGYEPLAEYLRNFVETKIAVNMVDDIYVEIFGLSLYQNMQPAQGSTDTYSSVQTSPLNTLFAKNTLYSTAQFPRPNRTDEISQDTGLIGRSADPNSGHGRERSREKAYLGKRPPKPPQKAATLPTGFAIGPEIPSPGTCGSRSQEELKQIQTLCADGRLSVDNALGLFDAWKLRFCGPTQSFKERQEALESLRQDFRQTLENAEREKTKSQLGRVLTRLRTTRKQKRIAREDSEEDYEHINITSPSEASPDTERGSNSSGYSSAGGDPIDSQRGSAEGYQHQSIIERQKNKGHDTNKRMSRRMIALQEPGALRLDNAPPIPERATLRSRRPLPNPHRV